MEQTDNQGTKRKAEEDLKREESSDEEDEGGKQERTSDEDSSDEEMALTQDEEEVGDQKLWCMLNNYYHQKWLNFQTMNDQRYTETVPRRTGRVLHCDRC